MKTCIRTLLTATALAVAGLAQAAPFAFDNFDSYAPGTAIAGKNSGSGWAGAWTGSAGATVFATHGGDAPMSGNALSLVGNNNNAATRALASSINSNVWVDYLFQFDGGSMQDNDFLALWFGSQSGPNIGLKTNCGDGTGPGVSTPCGLDLFVRLSGSDGRYSTAIAIGQTYRIVGHLQKTSGNVYNRFDMWVNPTDLELTGMTGIDASAWAPGGPTGSGSTTLQSFSTIGWRTAELDSSSPQDRLLVDNLGLYSNAPSAANLRGNDVPEPGSLALVGLALLVGAGATRRKTRG